MFQKRVTLEGLWIRAEFLYNIGHWPLYLSQVKLYGLELPACWVFINSARYKRGILRCLLLVGEGGGGGGFYSSQLAIK